MTVLYVTDRDESLINSTREWLSRRGFPPGPIFFWSFRESPYSTQEYRKNLLRDLKKQWRRIDLGLGNSMEDIETYRDLGMKTILLSDPLPESLPQGTTGVRTWRALEDLLFKVE